MRKLILAAAVTLLSLLVLRLAARRSAASVPVLLGLLVLQAAQPEVTRNTPKTSATSARVDKLLTALTASHGSTSALSVGAQNSSQSIQGQNTSTPDGNTGASWATGERSYINNVVTSVGVLYGGFNLLQTSYSNTCAVITTMQNTLNTWHSALQNAGLL
jgi:beta-lactamase regulating signal transducer with metallopeptidase domain